MSNLQPSQPEATPPSSNLVSVFSRRAGWIWGGLAVALSFLAFVRTLHYQFVYDDHYSIVQNPAIRSWQFLPDYFTKHVWYGLYPGAQMNYYRPVFLLWLRLNHEFFGMEPWGWHLTTVLAHVVVTLLVYFLARRLANDDLTAGLSALVFAVHPIHIEVVDWVSGVTESLVAIFALASFLAYLRWRASRRSYRWLALSLILFLLGVLEKETALVLPAVVGVYELIYGDGWPALRFDRALLSRLRNAVVETLPFFALIAIYLPIRIHILHGFAPVETRLTLATVFFTWPSLFLFWIQHLFWPSRLSSCYDLGFVFQPTLANFTWPALVVLAALFLAVWAALRSRAAAFALAWMVIFALPVMDIRIFREEIFAQDRYLYVPSVGFALIAGLALRQVFAAALRRRAAWVAVTAGVLLLAGAMSWASMKEGNYFADDWKFFDQFFSSARHYKLVAVLNAKILFQRGRADDAARLYHQVLTNDPNFWPALSDLAYIYYREGKYAEAVDYFIRSIRSDPRLPEEYLYLGLSQLRLGHLYEAEVALRRAVEMNPTGYGYHFALGVVMEQSGALQEAREQFRAELGLNPNMTAARAKLAEVEAKLQNPRPEDSGTERKGSTRGDHP